jgi:hypothetical protein
MLQAGRQITQPNDPLIKIQPEYLYHAVKQPKADVEAAIRQLRLVRTIDENRYRQLKKQLPYITCGIFNPPFRRTENFGWINHFILDIDHLGQKDLSPETVKTNLTTDPRVKMAFVSPGEDGLKVLFALSEKCYDPARFSLFYKVFAKSFSETYHLQQVIDQRTSDVARACFVSHDPTAFYNPQPEEVNMAAFVDFTNPLTVFEIQSEIKKEEKETSNEKTEELPHGPDDETLAAIKARLNPSFRAKREKIIYVPEKIENMVTHIVELMQTNGIETREVVGINYGKKFRFTIGTREAEINVFYGKRGFSVVQTPRQGTNGEMNKICAQLISELLL